MPCFAGNIMGFINRLIYFPVLALAEMGVVEVDAREGDWGLQR